MSATPSQAPFRQYTTSLVLAAVGAFACLAVICVPFCTPEWYAYLNWKPGIASLLASHAFLIAGLLTTAVALHLLRTQQLAYVPLVLACIAALFNAQDIARHVGYSSGAAKVECWTPESRECLVGKFKRLEKLKSHKVPVALTEKEQAVFVSFKATRDKFEASKPSWSSDEFKSWAQSYQAELDKVFAGYPSAYPG
jgi:hypothetical protein